MNNKTEFGTIAARVFRALPRSALAAVLLMSVSVPAGAQTTKQIWPGINLYVKVNDQMRFYFASATVKESKEATQIEVGPNFDFYLKPFAKNPVKYLLLRLDESRNRPLTIRVGYRYIHPVIGESPNENRGVVEATARFPLKVGILLSDRSRADLRSIGGDYSWRYRNRLSVEKLFSAGPVKMDTYLRAETYYDSRYSKFSNTALTAGSTFPINKHFEFETYFEHQNSTSGSSNQELNAVGAVLSLYF